MHKFQNEILATTPAKLDLTDAGEGTIAGYGAIFDNVDRGGDLILKGAFTKSLQARKNNGDGVLMLWQHDMSKPVGRWTSVLEDERGLRVEGQFNLETEAGRNAYQHVKAGDLRGLSIGYLIPAGGRKYVSKGVFQISEIDLYEVSIVSMPMNPSATVQDVKHLNSKQEAIEMLRGAGMSKKAAARFAGGGWAALGQTIDPDAAKELASKMAAQMTKIKGSSK